MTVRTEPTPDHIQELRNRFRQYLKENGRDDFDHLDIDWLMHDDNLVRRYYVHIQPLGGDHLQHASDMIVKSLKWRKETGIRYITVADLDSTLREKPILYTRNRDVDGKKLLIFSVSQHQKGKNMDEMKKIFLYYVERLEREERGDQLTLFFDCTGAGLMNMDLDFTQFMIGVFKDNVPEILNYILVFQMPWVLNAGFQVIKRMLPADAVEKIKFLKKGNNTEYVAPDQRLAAWGGTDDWEFKFEPSQMKNGGLPPREPNNIAVEFDSDSSDDMKKKAVTFAAAKVNDRERRSKKSKMSQENMSRASSFNSMSGDAVGASLLSLNPPEEIKFSQGPQGDLVASVKVTNVSSGRVAFKIKTTSPDKYRVRPSMSCLSPGGSNSIEIYVQTSLIGSAASLVRDKFLITALEVDRDDITYQQIGELMKVSKPSGQYRLRCSLDAGIDGVSIMSTSSSMLASPGGDGSESIHSVVQKQADQIAKISKQVTSLVSSQDDLRNDLALSKMLLLVLLALLFLTFLLLFWRTHNLASICEHSIRESSEMTREEVL